MKKLILVFAAIAITAGSYAQIDSTNKKMNQQDKQTQNVQNNLDKSQTDGLVMKNGKLMVVKNGQSTLLDREMTMTNGTKIMTDGSFIDKNGSKRMWKEGERMDMSGNMVPAKTTVPVTP